MADPSPTIRIWICPKCNNMESVPAHGYGWCDGVPVEYVACPTSHAIRTWPNAHRLSIPAPEDHA